MSESQFNTLLQVLAQQGNSIELLKSAVAHLNIKMDRGFTEVRSEMGRGFAEVRSEMKKGFIEVRNEMDQGFTEVRSEMDQGFTDQAAISNDIIKHFEEQPATAPRTSKRRTLQSPL